MIFFVRRKVCWRILMGGMLLVSIFAVPRGRADSPPRGARRTPPVALAEGVYFQQFHLSVEGRPVNFFVVRMQRDRPDLTLDSVIAAGALAQGRESVPQMARRAERALSTWGESPWGRNHVLAAINGYYFDLESGTPWRGQVQSGWYVQRFDDVESGSGFAWKRDGTPFVGGCLYHPAGRQKVVFLEQGTALRFQGLNRPRGENELVLYTSQYAADTGTGNNGLEVLVELDAPLGIAPAGSDSLVTGVVRAVRDKAGSTPLPFGYVVLSAQGKARRSLLRLAEVGARLGIHQEIAHFESDCKTPSKYDWGGTYAALGGDYVLLREGHLPNITRPEAQQRNSRTAVAFNQAFVFFVVADGWNPGVSEGVTTEQLAAFLRDVLGATDAITQDSGGSATMWVRGRIVNNTYCNFTRNCGPDGEPGADGVYPRLQPLVGNALLMVQVLPGEQSRTFARGEGVRTRRPTYLYQGPGSTFAVAGTLPAGQKGVILPTRLHLGGIRADRSYWWRVRFGDLEGWLREEVLAGGTLPDWGAVSGTAGSAPGFSFR